MGEIRTTNAGTMDLSEIAHQSIDWFAASRCQSAPNFGARHRNSECRTTPCRRRGDDRAVTACIFVPTTKLSTTGKVVAKQGATAASKSDDERESLIVSSDVFNSFNHRQVVAVGQLKPMRQQILGEHHVRYERFPAIRRVQPSSPAGTRAVFRSRALRWTSRKPARGSAHPGSSAGKLDPLDAARTSGW